MVFAPLKTDQVPVFRVPAEWAPQRAIWTAWPSHPELWQDDLDGARDEVAAMIRALADPDDPSSVRILACGDEAVDNARSQLGTCAQIIPVDFGDIWLRDTGPIFATRNGGTVALRFRHNGWGGKYLLPHDDTVGDRMIDQAGHPALRFGFVLEGGAIDHNGEGVLLTTRQCVLNPNRNPEWDESSATRALCDAFGAHTVLWLDDGLLNDHTDGHIDNIARFVAPDHVLCQSPYGDDDPNARVLMQIEDQLRGFGLRVSTIPSPGRVMDDEGEIKPASHMNFIIGNRAVVVPVYNTPSGAESVRVIQTLFPTRRVIGVPSIHLLSGGGSFHCITQQEPQ